MEELLRLAYMNFVGLYEEKSGDTRKMDSEERAFFQKLDEKLGRILNKQLFDDVSEMAAGQLSRIREAAFFAGFSYCAKFLTHGKVDFLYDEKGGAAE